MRINGHPKEQNSFARVSGYVEQFDTHSAAATVHEALMFSGVLRNENDIDHDTTEAFVDQVCTHALTHSTATAILAMHCQSRSPDVSNLGNVIWFLDRLLSLGSAATYVFCAI